MTQLVTHKIVEMFAYVTIDDVGEHLLGVRRGLNWQPLIAESEDQARQMLPLAKRAAAALHRDAKLVRFGSREEQPLN